MKTERKKALVRLPSSVKIGFGILALVLAFSAKGQDPVFSQFHLNKNHLNPSYAGYTQDLSLGTSFRTQWTHIPDVFSTTSSTYANIGCNSARLGFGLGYLNHREGEGFLRNQNLTLQASVNFPALMPRWLSRRLRRKKFLFAGGLSLGVGQKSLDWSKLTFSDQFDAYSGFTGNPSLVMARNDVSNAIFDVGAGLRLQAPFGRKGSFVSIGASGFHLNQPVESFFNVENELKSRYTIHAFVYFQTKKFVNNPDFVSVGLIRDIQQTLETNTILAYKDVGNNMKAGFGFRRQKFLPDYNVDAFIFQGILSFRQWSFGYSYDLTISSLGPQRTFGTHEISLVYLFKDSALCARSKSDDCFFLNDEIREEFKKLYLWDP